MNQYLPLVMLTFKAPAQAARILLSANWPREAIWTALFLAVILNAILHLVMKEMFPLPPELAFMQISATTYAGVSAALTVAFAAMVTLCGRWIGGQGKFFPFLSLLVWLQILQVFVQVALMVVSVISPGIGGLVTLALNFYFIFILLHFINEVQKFGSLWRAFGVLLMASFVVLFAMIFVLGLMGPSTLGLPANV